MALQQGAIAMTDGVKFGYQRFDPGVGTYVMPGAEVRHLTGVPGAHVPITIGAFTYRISGRKGHIVNWLVEHGAQVVRVDGRNPAFAAHHLTLVLHQPEKKLHEVVGEATAKIAGHFMPHGVVGQLWEARERIGTAFATAEAAGDAWEAHRESRVAAGAGVPKHYTMPWMTAPKILDICLGVSRTEEEAALRVVPTRFREMNFSNIAAWMFGS